MRKIIMFILTISMVFSASSVCAQKYAEKVSEFIKEGFEGEQHNVTIEEGQTFALTDTLKQAQRSVTSSGGSGAATETLTVSGVTFNMVRVAGGTFTMGATSGQKGDAYSDEKRTHSVTLDSYYIGQTEVTQALWQAVMGSNPSYYKGDNLPVEQVSWDDCQTFISKLNAATGKKFRLPTEAEWEFAARGGNKSHGYEYSGNNNIGNVAWYDDNSDAKTHAVAAKQANELGIYDMSGNVWEWCSDWYGDYSSASQTNPVDPTSGQLRMRRGGSWNGGVRCCRMSLRGISAPGRRYNGLGLRLALSE